MEVLIPQTWISDSN